MAIEPEDGPRAVENDVIKYAALLKNLEDENLRDGNIFQAAGYARIRRTLIDGHLAGRAALRAQGEG